MNDPRFVFAFCSKNLRQGHQTTPVKIPGVGQTWAVQPIQQDSHMRIGLVGLAGSGKSEVSAVLTSSFGFTRVKFADPLKNMLRTMLTDIGHTAQDAERYVEGDLKETVVDGLDGLGITARHLMQTLGTEFGRKAVHPELWVTLWKARAERFEHVIADDVRFENEVDAIRSAGGEIWQIVRPGLTAMEHVSEQLAVEADCVIHNRSDLAGLHEAVHEIARLKGLAPIV